MLGSTYSVTGKLFLFCISYVMEVCAPSFGVPLAWVLQEVTGGYVAECKVQESIQQLPCS